MYKCLTIPLMSSKMRLKDKRIRFYPKYRVKQPFTCVRKNSCFEIFLNSLWNTPLLVASQLYLKKFSVVVFPYELKKTFREALSSLLQKISIQLLLFWHLIRKILMDGRTFKLIQSLVHIPNNMQKSQLANKYFNLLLPVIKIYLGIKNISWTRVQPTTVTYQKWYKKDK